MSAAERGALKLPGAAARVAAATAAAARPTDEPAGVGARRHALVSNHRLAHAQPHLQGSAHASVTWRMRASSGHGLRVQRALTVATSTCASGANQQARLNAPGSDSGKQKMECRAAHEEHVK